MLVLTRKENEQIRIGDEVTITVVAIRGGSVRLGIDAPSSVSVHREEVQRAIEAGKQPPIARKGSKEKPVPPKDGGRTHMEVDVPLSSLKAPPDEPGPGKPTT